MSKFKVTLNHGNSDSGKIVGVYSNINDAAESGWSYAHEHDYINSRCETHKSVIEALTTRQFCMLGYGPNCIEIEETD